MKPRIWTIINGEDDKGYAVEELVKVVPVSDVLELVKELKEEIREMNAVPYYDITRLIDAKFKPFKNHANIKELI